MQRLWNSSLKILPAMSCFVHFFMSLSIFKNSNFFAANNNQPLTCQKTRQNRCKNCHGNIGPSNKLKNLNNCTQESWCCCKYRTFLKLVSLEYHIAFQCNDAQAQQTAQSYTCSGLSFEFQLMLDCKLLSDFMPLCNEHPNLWWCTIPENNQKNNLDILDVCVDIIVQRKTFIFLCPKIEPHKIQNCICNYQKQHKQRI